MAIGILVSTAVARYLGPQLFGRLNFALALTSVLGILAGLGLENRAKKEMVEHPEKRDTIMGTYFAATLVASTLLYLALTSSAIFFLQSMETIAMYMVLGAVFLLIPLRNTEFWFQATVKSKLLVIASFFGVAAAAFLKFSLILAEARIVWFAVAILFETILSCLLLLRMYRFSGYSILNWKLDTILLRRFLKDGWPLLVSGLAAAVYMQVDQIMLGLMVDETAVGQYAAAVRVSTALYFVPVLLGRSLFPAIVSFRQQSIHRFNVRVRQYFELNALAAYGFVIPLFLLSTPLIHFLYGEGYSEASIILKFHIWAAIFVFLGVARGQVLIAEGFYKIAMHSTVAAALVNIVLNLFLIPRFGGIGAALATLIAQIFASVLILFAYKRTRPLGITLLKSAVYPRSLITGFKIGS